MYYLAIRMRSSVFHEVGADLKEKNGEYRFVNISSLLK
jgi:hypothetical protein